MKKVIRFLIIICISLILLFNLPTNSVFGEKEDGFTNVEFTAIPSIYDKNVLCTIKWLSPEEIGYLEVTIVLPNNSGFNKKFYLNNREANEKPEDFNSYKIGENKYQNILIIKVPNEQIGTMEVVFKYGQDYFSTKEVTYFFSGGTWVRKQTPSKAIFGGFIITLCAALATYVVIENSHRNIITIDNDEDDEEDEVINKKGRKNE